MIRDILDSFQLYGNAKGGPLRNLHEFADVTDPNFHHERQYEIHRYLFSKGDDDDDDDDDNTSNCFGPKVDGRSVAWVALDDEELLEGDSNSAYRDLFEGRAVKINSRTGITDQDAILAIQLLKKQLQES